MSGSGAWKIAGVSVIGSAHVADGSPCQDYHRVCDGGNGWLVALVSDGAGSATYGADGARLLCDGIMERVLEHFPDPVSVSPRVALLNICRRIAQAIAIAREHVNEIALARRSKLDDFHATLVGVAAFPSVGGIFFHIGDGAAVAFDEEGNENKISKPENGEFAETTYFFTGDDWRRHLRFSCFNGLFSSVVLMSDGVTDIAFQRDGAGFQPHAPFFKPLCNYLKDNTRTKGEAALEGTLSSAHVISRTNDDKTLVWAQLSRG